jgi:hypothetical protein
MRVVEKGNALRAKLQEHHASSKAEDEKQEREKLMEEFKKLTQNLHHLLSTTQVPGVYGGPNEVSDHH